MVLVLVPVMVVETVVLVVGCIAAKVAHYLVNYFVVWYQKGVEECWLPSIVVVAVEKYEEENGRVEGVEVVGVVGVVGVVESVVADVVIVEVVADTLVAPI